MISVSSCIYLHSNKKSYEADGLKWTKLEKLHFYESEAYAQLPLSR